MPYKADKAPYYTFDHGDAVKIVVTPPFKNIRGTFHARTEKNGKTWYIVEQSDTGMHFWSEPEYVIPDKLDSKNPNNTFKRVV